MRCSNVIILSVTVRQTDVAHSTRKGLSKMYSELKAAVLQQLNGCEETLQDIAKHPDAQAGWPGFTYYSDLEAFYDRHRELIFYELRVFADELGEEVTKLVQGFNIWTDADIPDSMSIAAVLLGDYSYSNEDLTAHIKTALVYFALEHVAHQVADELEQEVTA